MCLPICSCVKLCVVEPRITSVCVSVVVPRICLCLCGGASHLSVSLWWCLASVCVSVVVPRICLCLCLCLCGGASHHMLHAITCCKRVRVSERTQCARVNSLSVGV
jgi:hypothetical protein